MLAILFVHGIIEKKEQFNDFVAIFSKDFKCYSITLPGHDKDVLDFGRHNAKEWEEYVWQYLLFLKSKYEVVYALGHSLGGLILINILKQHPGVVDKLICLALPLKIRPKFSGLIDSLRVGFKLYKANNLRLTTKASLYAFKPCRNIFKYYRWPSRYLELFLLSFKARKSIRKLTLPTLVINSRNDEMVSYKIRKYLPATTRYLMFNLSGHAIYDAKEREQIILECYNYLREC